VALVLVDPASRRLGRVRRSSTASIESLASVLSKSNASTIRG
jgi:hypothetical protein